MFFNASVFSKPDGARVLLTLENNIVTRTLRQRDALEDRISSEILSGLSEYELAAVQAVYAKGRITTRELARIIGRSAKSASATLKSLEAQGVLMWHGTSTNDPAQHYTLR